MSHTVCGQVIAHPPSPDKVECYDAAEAWLAEQCPLCGGNEACEQDLRAIYLAKIFACDHPMMAETAKHVEHVFEVRRTNRKHRRN